MFVTTGFPMSYRFTVEGDRLYHFNVQIDKAVDGFSGVITLEENESMSLSGSTERHDVISKAVSLILIQMDVWLGSSPLANKDISIKTIKELPLLIHLNLNFSDSDDWLEGIFG